MELIKASVTTVSPLTVTIDGSAAPIPGTLVTGSPVANALCWLLFPPGGLPPLVMVP